ncbi:hypothetical protein BOTBODRAFT_180089 [Botryobasidium botryosum FD-172 SS1]|uniref:Uncharacterized protein n=1 Tax=Botryobasidium botryosum (strain FD-172 SS1) TaxID=930990 RepID=A0A067LY61_BOTB1|nr:hypothetical protein BOTBODRAFT_180089 [Botryobasidium botryosum FD-172 SS1]
MPRFLILRCELPQEYKGAATSLSARFSVQEPQYGGDDEDMDEAQTHETQGNQVYYYPPTSAPAQGSQFIPPSALALFFWGLIEFLWGVNATVAAVTFALIGIAASFFAFTTVSPLFSSRCPYESPLSPVLRKIFMRVGYYCRGAWLFFLEGKIRFLGAPGDLHDAWVQYRATRAAFEDERHACFSKSALHLAERVDIEQSADYVEAEAIAWLIDSSPADVDIQDALRASEQVMVTRSTLSALKGTGVAFVAARHLANFLARPHISDTDAVIAGASARICALLYDPASISIFTRPHSRFNQNTTLHLRQHPNVNVACYVTCALIRILCPARDNPREAKLIQCLCRELEGLLARPPVAWQRAHNFERRALALAFDTLNACMTLAAVDFVVNDETVRRAVALFDLKDNPRGVHLAVVILRSHPRDLYRAVITTLILHHEKSTPGFPKMPNSMSDAEVSQLVVHLLSHFAQGSLQDPEVYNTVLKILRSIPESIKDQRNALRWMDDGICPVLAHPLSLAKADGAVLSMSE